MSRIFRNEIIKQCLAQIRKIEGLIQFNLRINPFCSNNLKLSSLLDSLRHHQIIASKLLLNHKIEPPLFTCPLIAKAGLLISESLNLKSNDKNQEIMAAMQKSQQWVNDTLRQMNQKQAQQKQTREAIIKLRNILEQYTEGQKQRYGPNNGLYSKLIKYMI